MLTVRSQKVCPVLEKDGKALVAGCSRVCGVIHCGFCVLGCSLFCVSDPLYSHWSPPGTFFLPLLLARHPRSTTVIPLRICSLSELMECFCCLESMYFSLWLSCFWYSTSFTWLSHFRQVILISVLAGASAGTCVYTLTSLRGNVHICRSTSFLLQEHGFW